MFVNEQRNASLDRTYGLTPGTLMLAMGLTVAGTSLIATPSERMRDLWVHDPGIAHVPRFSATVAPTRGGGYFGLTAGF